MTQVFVSYCRKDEQLADAFCQAMQDAGIEYFIDQHIEAGLDWSSRLESELNAAEIVVTLWTEASVQSSFVRNEARRALRDNKLLPVKLTECDVPVEFDNVQWLDCIEEVRVGLGFNSIIEALAKKLSGFNEPITMLRETTDHALLGTTPEQERVLRALFGIGRTRALSLEELSAATNWSVDEIKELRAQALRKLKHPSRSRKLRSLLNN